MTVGKIYVPREVDHEIHQTVQKNLAEAYGGFTRYRAGGGWVNDNGELEKESVLVYEVVAPSTADGGEMYVLFQSLARTVKDLSDQTEVLAYVGASEDSSGETIVVS